eukprot:3798772-Pyramimonas_sp.AAC.1
MVITGARNYEQQEKCAAFQAEGHVQLGLQRAGMGEAEQREASQREAQASRHRGPLESHR